MRAVRVEGRGHAESTRPGDRLDRGGERDGYSLGFGALKISVVFVNPEPKPSLPSWFCLQNNFLPHFPSSNVYSASVSQAVHQVT